MQLATGKLVAERFRLVRLLGKGGMGSVWLAQDVSLDTPCAVKFIHGEAAESVEMRSRFEREAKSAAQLRSPHVVSILAHGVSEATPYIAMEYLEGEDLERRIERLGRLSPRQTLAVISQVAKALGRAHAAGLVHRDLKPANIFLVPDEEGDLAKVLDFGVAKSNAFSSDGATKTGAMIGTPYYMSPEQARGTKAVDHRSDLWALAVIVFRCVTGRLPFMSDGLGDLMMAIITDPLPVPSRVASGLPASFDAWWARAAMRDPAQRFQSARELVDAFALSFGLAESRPGITGDSLAGAGYDSRAPWVPGMAATPGSGQVAPLTASAPGPSGAVSSPGSVPPAGTVLMSSSASSPGALTSSVAGGASGAMASAVLPSMPPKPARSGVAVIAVVSGVLLLGGLAAAASFLRGGAPTASAPASGAELAAPPPSGSTSASATGAPVVQTAKPIIATPTAPLPSDPPALPAAASSTVPSATAPSSPVPPLAPSARRLGKPWPGKAAKAVHDDGI